MLCRHQDFLYYLRDTCNRFVSWDIDSYLDKYHWTRRTWNEETACDDFSEVKKLLIEGKFIKEDIIWDNKVEIDIDLDMRYYEVHTLLKEIKKYKMLNFRKLTVYPMNKLSSVGIIDLNMFFECTIPDNIKILAACTGDILDIDQFMPGLTAALPNVRDQIYLAGFKISQDNLK